jgi:hypothetical protein
MYVPKHVPRYRGTTICCSYKHALNALRIAKHRRGCSNYQLCSSHITFTYYILNLPILCFIVKRKSRNDGSYSGKNQEEFCNFIAQHFTYFYKCYRFSFIYELTMYSPCFEYLYQGLHRRFHVKDK